ncbi:MAG: 5-methyltetrahydropteroyltriglutamate--homocysteine S-methyltransferase [Eubacteriales bacterium]|nr:5-methyltetrahydropteroyltriglutamate--homocysteine S-methyltransferase [Eubacteriales bacterium]
MSQVNTPFRYDFVGSFLRPTKLKQARADFEAGRISREELSAVEDSCICSLVTKLKELGYHTITDGEFRRATWHLDFMWGFQGVEHHKTENGVCFHGEQALIDDTYLVGKISAVHHPFVDHFKFVKALEDENTVAKQTIPAPAQFFQQMLIPANIDRTRQFYPTNEELIADIAAGYRTIIRELYDAGCRNIQLDDCTWGAIVGDAGAERYAKLGLSLAEIKELFLTVNNLAIEGKPDDLVINTHICRGNYHSTFFSSGAYDNVAEPLFGRENVDAYYLEYDDERSGGFEPLKYVSGDKKVVLGLITTKSSELEDKAAVISRIREATAYIPLERLYLSPQCGFASCEIGNKLTEEQQWAKLALVKEIAEQVWG